VCKAAVTTTVTHIALTYTSPALVEETHSILLTDLLPWKWVLSPSNPLLTQCPARYDILATMGAVNAIAAWTAILMHRRGWIRILTCGLLEVLPPGTTDPNAWRWRWIIPLALQLGANATIAALFKYSRGYTATFSILELTILYTTRPRLEFIRFTLNNLLRSRYFSSRSARMAVGGLEEAEYANPRQTVGLAHMLAEIGLQLLALDLMRRVVARGQSNGFYNAILYAALPISAQRIYGGAAAYLVVGSVALALQAVLVGLSSFAARHWREDREEAAIAEEEEAMAKGPWMFVHGLRAALTCLTVWGTWLASNSFWSGFVYLAQDR